LVEVTIQHLRVLAVLAEEGSFRRAAARLGIGQPALSRQVRRIEQALDADLVVRTAGGVIMTEAGEVVARRFKEFSDTFDQLVQHVRATAEKRDAASDPPGRE
jgi:molybdate transport repressor ModE-like protein